MRRRAPYTAGPSPGYSRVMPGDAGLKRATYADVLSQPETVVAEVVHGVLHTLPRPRLRHAAAASVLGEELGPPFKRGRGGPGGWVILDEPELHLGSEPARRLSPVR